MKQVLKNLCFCLMAAVMLSSCEKEVLPGGIYGVINDATNGQLLSSAIITLSPGGISFTTGSDGRYEFADLEPGRYTVQASKNDYQSDFVNVTVVAGQYVTSDIRLQPIAREAAIEISSTSLNFGATQTELAISIKNNGNESASWSVDLGSHRWLSASPTAGTIGAKKTQSISFKVNRDKISETQSVIVNLSADNNSYPITINCMPKDTKVGKMEISPKSLDFGSTTSQLNLTIKNSGEGDLGWGISNIDSECLSVSDMSGIIAPDGNKIVQVNLNRDIMPESLETSFIVSDGSKEEIVYVKASKNSGNDDNGEEPGEDNGEVETPGGEEPDGTFSGTVTSIRSNLAVEITGVSVSNNVLTVNFTIQNNEDFDIEKLLFNSTNYNADDFMAYDNLGNSYTNAATQELKIGSSISSAPYHTLEMYLPQDVMLSCHLKIKGIPDDVTNFVNITLPCEYSGQSTNYDQNSIVFKNLNWGKTANNNTSNTGTFSGTVTSIRSDLAVKITGISATNNVLTVNFTIQNNEAFDIEEIYFNSTNYNAADFMAYDNLGNSYTNAAIQELKIGSSISSAPYHDLRMYLPQDVMLSCHLKIKGIPDDVTDFVNITLPCEYRGQSTNYDQNSIVFKNLNWK